MGSTGGSNAVNDVLSGITLGSGANSVENNFGEIVTASLGDRLWTDTNGDGKQTTGEVGIVGATVTLIGGGADGLINGIGDTTATTTTGADGIYNFAGLTPGQQYQVQFSAPAGTVSRARTWAPTASTPSTPTPMSPPARRRSSRWPKASTTRRWTRGCTHRPSCRVMCTRTWATTVCATASRPSLAWC
ncbi:MAG: hypothetical protein IPJ27_00090 [Candidatus Accumulibacter sp.]|uniref:SD-repeat containing protein B domain-containing protein n=1 Tax=Candidatus Accumulibacter proximus TaxID=2954385 RepID=A0A935PTZ0_9PROT|nr:hypothetical protein [Candidatus Accumulibacter proximus]